VYKLINCFILINKFEFVKATKRIVSLKALINKPTFAKTAKRRSFGKWVVFVNFSKLSQKPDNLSKIGGCASKNISNGFAK